MSSQNQTDKNAVTKCLYIFIKYTVEYSRIDRTNSVLLYCITIKKRLWENFTFDQLVDIQKEWSKRSAVQAGSKRTSPLGPKH